MKTLILALILVGSPLMARATLPEYLAASCTALSNRRACGWDACSCELVKEVAGGSKLLGKAAVLRASDKEQRTVTFNLLIETNGAWIDYGELHTAVSGSNGDESSGSVNRFEMVETLGGGRVLRVDFQSRVTMTNEEQNVRASTSWNGLVLAFAQGDELAVIELTTMKDTSVSRLNKKGKRPPAKIYGPLGTFRWERDVELLDSGCVRVSNRRGTHPIVRKKDLFAGEHALDGLDRLHANELNLRYPEI